MGAIKDVIEAMNKVVLMNDKIERTGRALSEISKELRDHKRKVGSDWDFHWGGEVSTT